MKVNLIEFVEQHREEILAGMLDGLKQGPSPAYRELLLNTPEGQERMRRWMQLAVEALNGNSEPFFRDQTKLGYMRSMQGFSLDALSLVHKNYLKNVTDVICARTHELHPPGSEVYAQLSQLMYITLMAFQQVAQAFIAAREEIIDQKIGLLQKLYHFTQKLMAPHRRQEIVQICLEELPGVFGAKSCHLALRQGESLMFTRAARLAYSQKEFLLDLANECWEKDRPLFVDQNTTVSHDIERTTMKQLVVAPVKGHDKRQGVVILVNRLSPMSFKQADLELLRQFLYITAVVLENAEMVEAAAESRRQLALFTQNTINVQEQERKRISEDIHDSLTQTLTGICYKLRYLKRIGSNDPDQVSLELGELIQTTGRAVEQSRNMIASLHPGLIDNLGLSLALAKLVDNFNEKLGFQIRLSIPERIDLSSHVTTGLYRVLQEALTNIHKHAGATRVELWIVMDDNTLHFGVNDNGRGFSMDHFPGDMVDRGQFGLFYMQQRIELLGGVLAIQALPGHGCSVVGQLSMNQGMHEAACQSA